MNHNDSLRPSEFGVDSASFGGHDSSNAFISEFMETYNTPTASGKGNSSQYPANSTARLLQGVPGVDIDSVLAASQNWRVESLENYLSAQTREERLKAIENLRKEFLNAQLTNDPEVTNIEAAKNLVERLDLQARIQETAGSPEAQKHALHDFLRAQRRAGDTGLTYLGGDSELPFATSDSSPRGVTSAAGPLTYEDFRKAVSDKTSSNLQNSTADNTDASAEGKRVLLQNVSREVFEKAMAADLEEGQKELQETQKLMRDFIKASLSTDPSSKNERHRCIEAIEKAAGNDHRDLESILKWMKETNRTIEKGTPEDLKKLEYDCADRYVRCLCAELKQQSAADDFAQVDRQLAGMILPETKQIRNTLDWLRVQKEVKKLNSSSTSDEVASCVNALCDEAKVGNKLARSLLAGHVLKPKDRRLLQESYNTKAANLLSEEVVHAIETKHPEQWAKSQMQMLETVSEVAGKAVDPESITALALKAMYLEVGNDNSLGVERAGSSAKRPDEAQIRQLAAQRDAVAGFFNMISTESQQIEISKAIFNAMRIGSEHASPLMQELYLRTGIERRLPDGTREFDLLCKWAIEHKEPNAIGILAQVFARAISKADAGDASKAFCTVMDAAKKFPETCPMIATVLESRVVPQLQERDAQLSFNKLDDYKPLLSVKEGYEDAATLYGALYSASKKISNQFEAENCAYEAKEIKRLLQAHAKELTSDWAEQVFHYFKNGPENVTFAASDSGFKLDFGTGALKKVLHSIPALRIPRDVDMLLGRVQGTEIENNTIKVNGLGAIDVSKKAPIPMEAGSAMISFSDLRADFKADASTNTITLTNLRNLQLSMNGARFEPFETVKLKLERNSGGKQSVRADVTVKDLFKTMVPPGALNMRFDLEEQQADKFRTAIEELAKNPKDRNLVSCALKCMEGSVATQSAEITSLLSMFEKVERQGDSIVFTAKEPKRIETGVISLDIPKVVTAKIEGGARKGFSINFEDAAPKVNLKLPGDLRQQLGIADGIGITKISVDPADSEGVRRIALTTDSAARELSLYIDKNMRIAQKNGKTSVSLKYEKDECKLDLQFALDSKKNAQDVIDASHGGNPNALLGCDWSIKMFGDEASRLDLLKKLGAPEQLSPAFAHVFSVEHKDGDLIFGRTSTAPGKVDVHGLKLKLEQEIVVSGFNVKNPDQKKSEIRVRGIALSELPDKVYGKDLLTRIFKDKLPVAIKKLELIQNDDGSSNFRIVETSGLLRSADLSVNAERKPTYMTLVVDDPIETIGTFSGPINRSLTIKCRFDENGNPTIDNEASVIGELGLNFLDSGAGQTLMPTFSLGTRLGKVIGLINP